MIKYKISNELKQMLNNDDLTTLNKAVVIYC